MGTTTPTRPGSEYRVPTSALRVDAACDRFEAAVRAGHGPRIEEFLGDVDASCRRVLLRELLLLEIELHRSAGVNPVAAAYRTRFPADADLIDAAFAGVERPPSGVRGGPVRGSSDGRRETAATTERRPKRPRLTVAAVGRYVVVGKLSEGREAVVYRVLDPDQRKEFVLEWGRRPLPPDRLAEVGRQWTGLAHRNLVQVVDVGHHDGRPYLVTEPAPGLSLGQYTARQRPSPRRAAALVADLAGAVAYLQGRGLVGPGIKPADVLIDGSGQPRLNVLGLARLHGDQPSAVVSDLGALLHELLTGLPLRPAAPRVPKALEQVCRRALAQDPGDRYTDAAELERALRGCLRRRGAVAAAVAVLVLVALAVSGARIATGL